MICDVRYILAFRSRRAAKRPAGTQEVSERSKRSEMTARYRERLEFPIKHPLRLEFIHLPLDVVSYQHFE